MAALWLIAALVLAVVWRKAYTLVAPGLKRRRESSSDNLSYRSYEFLWLIMTMIGLGLELLLIIGFIRAAKSFL